MGLQALGRNQLSKMIALAPQGTALATFKLFGDTTYDPNTGQGSAPVLLDPIKVFVSKADDRETKDGAVTRASSILVFADGILPRRPETQDEVLVDAVLHKVVSVETDAMGVQMKVYVLQS